MYVVIVGGGRLGTSIAASLAGGGHEAFLLDRDSARVAAFRSEMGGIAGVGDGTSLRNLTEAGVSRASVVVAATGSDEDNLAVCQLAKWNFDVPKTIALVHRPENVELFETCGVDVVVSVPEIIMSSLATSLPAHPLIKMMRMHDRGLEVVGLKIPAGAEVAGKLLREIQLPYGSTVALIVNKEGRAEPPRADTRLEGEEVVLALSPVAFTQALWEMLTELH